MIICKFTKTDSAVYIPHLDLLREMNRAVRRADLQVAFSEGFNPHMLLYFSQPLPLGMNSIAEYFCADSKENARVFAERINFKLPRGVKILASATCEKASVHAEITHAEYKYTFEKPVPQQWIDGIMNSESLLIPVKTKKGIADSDVRQKIHSLTANGNELTAILGCGFNNLRADSFGNYVSHELFGDSNYEVLKVGSYATKEGRLISIDEVYALETNLKEGEKVGA